MENEINLPIKGYNIYCENIQTKQLYDFFIPKEQYRMTKQEAESYVPDHSRLLAVKRETRVYKIPFENFIDLAKLIDTEQ